MAGKKINPEEEAKMKFWLLTPTWNQVLRLAMLKTILRKNNNSSSSNKP
jgi:hypothetical protein